MHVLKYKLVSIAILTVLFFTSTAQKIDIQRIEPANWWVGMKNPELQILLYGKDISQFQVNINYEGVRLVKVIKAESPDYLFLDLMIDKSAKAGLVRIDFSLNEKIVRSINYPLKERRGGSADRIGFSNSDVIYLLMPDRFSNGNPANDDMPAMLDKADRNNPDGRHGGDIKGISDHLDYFSKLGVTAIWLNPLLENNQPKYSYHGYAITDFYKTDSRFGSNEDYYNLVKQCHDRGIKVIMDMIFNHCGSNHWWMSNLPFNNWLNQWPEFTRSNYRASSIVDPYASDWDKTLQNKGWFDQNMPDLNQKNPLLSKYLIQNSIWWIESADLDGIRMDTYPYPDKNFMSIWAKEVMNEYPDFNIVGEAWLNSPPFVAYYQKNALNHDGYNSNVPAVFDFPMYFAISKAFAEDDGWETGILRLYEILVQDYLYPDPDNIVVFGDNHDLNRLFTNLNEDFDYWKMAMAFIFTTRGIPMIYYGTELLMTGKEHDGHGFIRKDFPGGWKNDISNAFTNNNLTNQQLQAMEYLQKLINWRKNSLVAQKGSLKHFIPENGLYVYFRFLPNGQTLMIVMNKNNVARKIDIKKYLEVTESFNRGKDVITGENHQLSDLTVKAKTALILELY